MFSNETTPAYAPMFLAKYVAGQLEERQLYLRDNGFNDRLRIKFFFNETNIEHAFNNGEVFIECIEGFLVICFKKALH